MGRLETLIDNLLIYLPPDIPFLATLIERPDGRYIIIGIAFIAALLLAWLILAALQMVFLSRRSEPEIDKKMPVELSAQAENGNAVKDEGQDGFSFFKKAKEAEKEGGDEDPTLVAIEQEMLAVRALYRGGHIIKGVYVSETRRLYAKARQVKNSQLE